MNNIELVDLLAALADAFGVPGVVAGVWHAGHTSFACRAATCACRLHRDRRKGSSTCIGHAGTRVRAQGRHCHRLVLPRHATNRQAGRRMALGGGPRRLRERREIPVSGQRSRWMARSISWLRRSLVAPQNRR